MTDAKFEKLVQEIMAECAADNEPVTEAEAREMAEMEMKSRKDCKLVVRPIDTPEEKAKKAKVKKERKVDADKKELIEMFKTLVDGCVNNEPDKFGNLSMENENKIHFSFNGAEYTLNLVKHRAPKAAK